MMQTSRNASYRSLFASEISVLEQAKLTASQSESPNSMDDKFRVLTQQYESLLKTTVKIARISDIQGRLVKEQEHEVKTALAELKHSEQLRRKLIADISHELGTPMATVQGYMKALIDGVVRSDAPVLSMLYEKMVEMNQLIEDLFFLSTLEANQVHFNWNRAVVAELFPSLFSKCAKETSELGIQLEYGPFRNLPDSHVTVARVDPLRMEQVLSVLVRNAIRYTGKGGKLRISAQIEPAAKSKRKKNMEVSGQQLTIKVTHNGPAIEDSELPFVFDRFYKGTLSHPSIQGTGLGLAISKQIIEKHGGHMGIAIHRGGRNTYSFTIPVEMHPS